MHYLLAPLVFASFLSTNKTKQEVPAMESLLPLLSAVDTMEGDTKKKKKKTHPLWNLLLFYFLKGDGLGIDQKMAVDKKV